MDISGIIVGALIGVGGMIAKDTLFGRQTNNTSQDEIKTLYDENERLRGRNKEAERRIEDLMAEIQKLRRENKSKTEESEDVEDEIDSLRTRLRRAQSSIDELKRRNSELQKAVESYEMENINKNNSIL